MTGRLDRATVAKMKSPRCGRPDKDPKYETGSKWSKTALTYGMLNYGQDLPRGTQDRVFAKAFKYWSDVSKLTFRKASSGGSADITIR